MYINVYLEFGQYFAGIFNSNGLSGGNHVSCICKFNYILIDGSAGSIIVLHFIQQTYYLLIYSSTFLADNTFDLFKEMEGQIDGQIDRYLSLLFVYDNNTIILLYYLLYYYTPSSQYLHSEISQYWFMIRAQQIVFAIQRLIYLQMRRTQTCLP